MTWAAPQALANYAAWRARIEAASDFTTPGTFTAVEWRDIEADLVQTLFAITLRSLVHGTPANQNLIEWDDANSRFVYVAKPATVTLRDLVHGTPANENIIEWDNANSRFVYVAKPAGGGMADGNNYVNSFAATGTGASRSITLGRTGTLGDVTGSISNLLTLGTGTPEPVGSTASAGTSTLAAPFDHVHVGAGGMPPTTLGDLRVWAVTTGTTPPTVSAIAAGAGTHAITAENHMDQRITGPTFTQSAYVVFAQRDTNTDIDSILVQGFPSPLTAKQTFTVGSDNWEAWTVPVKWLPLRSGVTIDVRRI